MNIIGQLQPGIVEVVKPGTNRVIGYAFTVEDSDGGQFQRWLLHENPNNAFEIRPATGTTCSTLSDWQAYVQNNWKASSIYVWAHADVYVHGGTYMNTLWNQIPPVSALPNPNYPPQPDSAQTEYKCGSALTVQQNGSEGLVFTRGSLSDKLSVEYWMLPGSFQAAGGTSSAAVTSGANGSLQMNCLAAGASSAQTSSLDADVSNANAPPPPELAAELQQFINLANQRWSPGSRFVITGCVNYRGATAPTKP